ncbi:MAG TPA: DUF1249 domain-containing protein [Woeseiaceae bacterium]|nr:DUF1249 domain-containing protein [Woeseiaceae bacterium]
MPFASERLCYIGRMFLEHQIVPQAIAKPGSFVGLMSLYESNYLRLQQLIPEIARLDGYYRSSVAGDCDLHLEILDRSRYTVTLSLTYFFYDGDARVADPDMQVRVYFDGRLAEAMHLCGQHRHATLRRLIRQHKEELDVRWRRNIVLNKWLEYLMDQGHLVLER